MVRWILVLSIVLVAFFAIDIILFTLDLYVYKFSTHLLIGMYSLYMGELTLSSLIIVLFFRKNFSFMRQTLLFLFPVVVLGGVYDTMRTGSFNRMVTYVIEFICIFIILILISKLKLKENKF